MNSLISDAYLLVGFIVVSMVMGAIHRRLTSSGSILAVLYCLPFTILHELTHFLVAFFTGGRPSSFSVWPKRVGQGWVLGSVSSVPTIISAAPTALAPLLLLALGYYAMSLWAIRPPWVPEYLILGILYACSAACIPSWQDMKVALKHPFSLLLWVSVAYIVLRLK